MRFLSEAYLNQARATFARVLKLRSSERSTKAAANVVPQESAQPSTKQGSEVLNLQTIGIFTINFAPQGNKYQIHCMWTYQQKTSLIRPLVTALTQFPFIMCGADVVEFVSTTARA